MNYEDILLESDKLKKYLKEDDYFKEIDTDKNENENFKHDDECCICLESKSLWKTECNHIFYRRRNGHRRGR